MYPLGTVLRMKTTGENVVIVADGDGDKVEVRRPVNTTEQGVKHVIEQYELFELDTIEESIRREYNEIKIRQQLVKGEEFKAELVQ
jgi:hypothetical protein